MWAYQTAGRGGGVRESAVKWSGKNEIWLGKSQGISFQTKSGHPVELVTSLCYRIGLMTSQRQFIKGLLI